MATSALTLPHVRPVEPPVRAKPFDAEDPRMLNLLQGVLPDTITGAATRRAAAARPVSIFGVPFDGAVGGRKGAAEGPAAIREAFRYFSSFDATSDTQLLGLDLVDHGDVEVVPDDTRTTHDRAADVVEAVVRSGRVPVALGGDHSLTYAHVAGLARATEGRIGIIVVDAHYDLRPVGPDGHVSSGTPFRRILEELKPDAHGPRVRGMDLFEIGLRPFANSASLAAYAKGQDVRTVTTRELRLRGVDAVLSEAAERLQQVDHLWLSIDIDGVDQAHAPGCSAPTPEGLLPEELDTISRWAGSDARFAGLDLLETAPRYDPTGNTARVGALAILHALAGLVDGRK
ncbi:MAG: agmatinase family protein [Euryarchaeota archaeon]|nr:agmatinase family protein [Euryarchaeota archaeon]